MKDEAAQEIQSKALNPPRVTPDMLHNAIDQCSYYVFPGTTLTVCCIVLKNGFCVTGESMCVSLQDFSYAAGERSAFEDARMKLAQFMAFHLKQKLAAAA